DERPERGPDLEQVVGEAAVVLGALAVARGVLEQRAQLGLDGRHVGGQAVAVLVVVEAVPGLEEALGQRQAGLAEGLLLGQAVAQPGSSTLGTAEASTDATSASCGSAKIADAR